MVKGDAGNFDIRGNNISCVTISSEQNESINSPEIQEILDYDSFTNFSTYCGYNGNQTCSSAILNELYFYHQEVFSQKHLLIY